MLEETPVVYSFETRNTILLSYIGKVKKAPPAYSPLINVLYAGVRCPILHFLRTLAYSINCIVLGHARWKNTTIRHSRWLFL
jgi:hypothetical protein